MHIIPVRSRPRRAPERRRPRVRATRAVWQALGSPADVVGGRSAYARLRNGRGPGLTHYRTPLLQWALLTLAWWAAPCVAPRPHGALERPYVLNSASARRCASSEF